MPTKLKAPGGEHNTSPKLHPEPSVLLDYTRQQSDSMITLIRGLVEQESPSFDKAAVDQLGRMLADEFANRGGRVRLHRTPRFGDHLQVDFPARRGKPILLLGHFDTVWDVGTLKSMPWRKSDGRLWGPGVLDMKTGIAHILMGLQSLRETRGAIPRPVTVLLVSDEEVGSDSSRAITESLAKKSDAVLVLEPSTGLHGALKTARKGVGEYTVKIFGLASHAGLDFEKGHSAILELARQIAAIEKFTELKRGLTVNPGVVRGGTRTNVIPAEAQVGVDVRVACISDAARIDRKFRRLKAFNRHCRIEVEGGINRPPLERTPKVVNIFRHAQKAALELGFELQESAVGGGSDGNFTAALGIPTLDGLGGVGEGPHAPNESVLISELAPRTALLARLIETV
jgi:glutamate carboxypeptidase